MLLLHLLFIIFLNLTKTEQFIFIKPFLKHSKMHIFEKIVAGDITDFSDEKYDEIFENICIFS
mgnify:CR=1 FL=1